ncbi:MAG: patatin-like phospholipase family protein [Planctomycetia bacterium]|nr:patatin-like phospholipase family protein [Planctomycetia bacterium]
MRAAASLSPSLCRLLVLLLCTLAGGCCAHYQRCCVPKNLLVPEATIDLSSTSDHDATAERDALAASLARIKAAGPEPVEGARKYNVLALSGGGSYGAYTAGVINGWTASGQRPSLDIVSGVSTGALIATYAFLGPEYDHCLREFYTTTTKDDIYRMRAKPAVLWSDSAASSEPLKQLIEQRVTPKLLSAVAQAHAQGRRLYVGTTNLDTGRLVIWDMGAVASGSQGDALGLYRKIILASASVPGFFPPVSIDVTVNGRQYTEMHADGGTTAQVFFRASMLDLEPAQFAGGRRTLAGSRVYIIVAGKSFPDPKCVNDKALKIAASALGALTYAQTRNDLVRIYTLTLLTGMDFRLATIPQEMPIDPDSLSFERGEMQRLYQRGYQMASASQVWADVPPVLDASQQSIPRAGTKFLVPTEAALETGYPNNLSYLPR